MAASYASRCEFIRYVYRRATATSTTRTAVLDALADEHVPKDVSGKDLVSTSGNGFSASYQKAAGSTATYSLELINWARGYITEDDVEDSVALIPGPVRRFTPTFAGVRD